MNVKNFFSVVILISMFGMLGEMPKSAQAYSLAVAQPAPVVWNTFWGGYSTAGDGAVVDANGDLIIVGYGGGNWGNPINPHAGEDNAIGDAFVAKFDRDGTLLWNTFLGSTFDDQGYGIALDGSGNIYVSGRSNASWGNPVHGYSGGYDTFVARLNHDGSLEWNTFIGSAGREQNLSIATDTAGNSYIVGDTDSGWGNPIREYSGGLDAYMVKLNTNGEIQWNTFLGSASDDSAAGVAVDRDGNLYVAGSSFASWGNPNLPYQASERAGFVAKLDPNGAVVWNSFFGDYITWARGLSIDESGNTYITGYSEDNWGNPIISYSGGGEAYAAKFDNNGVLLWNTFLGSLAFDQGFAIAYDGTGNVYVVGDNAAPWGNPLNVNPDGGRDAFVVSLTREGVLQWHTFLGSTTIDQGFGIAADGHGYIYVTGYSGDTWGIPIHSHPGNADMMFVAKLASPNEPSDLPIVEFSLPNIGVQPSGLAVAPNGDVWFAEWAGGGALGRLSPDGTIKEFPNQGAPTLDVTVGADGNIWFTEIQYGGSPQGRIGRITPEGSITEFPIPTPTGFSPHNLTLGPDGNIWFTESGGAQIGKLTLDGFFTEYPVPVDQPHGITAGPDGNIWFTGYGSGNVGKITLNGNYTLYEVGSPGPFEIVTGPDGNIWFTEYWGPNVNRITPDGVLTKFPISSGFGTRGITVGADGNIWFTEPQNNKIGRITPDGVMTEYPIPTENSWPCYITSGPDGTLWLSELFGGKIGRIIINRSPAITMIIAPLNPIQLGQSIEATVVFSDPDIGDTHTVTWSWGDGTTTTTLATVPSVTTSHVYASAGVYTITATITDKANVSASATFQYIVVYDPNGGFVTGGGWINSPLGAYTPDPTLSGKAAFGFVSKYQKGANVPSGNTEFQFHVANMNFKSTSYDWLVVAGSKAQYKGTGTINGTGEYKFMLTAIDGSPDKFRIKIWDAVTSEVIYDNQLGTSETTDPITEIQGGSIVIHKAK